jgi:hypothetical protein
MAEPTPQVLASRQLLHEVCALLAPFRDDAVLIGGWVPEIRFPDAYPAHIGSIDVDFASRVSKARHGEIVALFLAHGFRPGEVPYRFAKNMDIGGKSFSVKLDLLTSPEHYAATFSGATQAPFPALGTEFAFSDPSLETVGGAEIRVASIVPMIVMKAHAILDRAKPKDAYDLHFCLENYPGGISALGQEFAGVIDDPAVQDVLTQLAGKFKDEEDSGPRDVVEVEGQMGESRAIRKFAVFTNVDDFLRAVHIRP